jgi:hypothetical protein
MGCGASSLRGDDNSSINANAKPSYLRSLGRSKPEASIERCQMQQDTEQDPQRLQSSQQSTASKPAYVDPGDLPMPPKTTYQQSHQRPSEKEVQQPAGGWKDMIKRAVQEVKTPAEQKGQGLNAGLTREDVLARGYPSRGSSGVFVPSGPTHASSNR